MNSWQKTVLENLLAKRFAIFRWLMTCLLVLSLSSCGEKAVSQNISISYKEKSQLISQQFSEVSPPATIQNLQSSLDIYQPQVTIVKPQADEVIQDNSVTVSLEVKDLPLFQDPKFQLGPHLEIILDNQPYQTIYDIKQPTIISDLAPGTHTLRVFASRPWGESFKNDGAFAQTTFHIYAKTDDNYADPALPLLTYNSPRGNYGAEPILLDFYLTNAPLRLVATENSDDEINDWRIRCTINDETFVFDRWQAIYLQGFKSGKNWVKLEFLDNQGNSVKNAFNTTVAVITYQPKGKDTLAQIVRGELGADEVRSIVDQSYSNKLSPTEAVPLPSPSVIPEDEQTPEVQPIPETKAVDTPQVEQTPEVQPIPETKAVDTPQVGDIPEIQPIPETKTVETPQAEPPIPSLTPQEEPESPELPKKLDLKPTRRSIGEYFQRRSRPVAQPTPSLSPTQPPEE
ncbi:hypothetical protein [Fortiea contorta]|uniref:hypothetical protein n=1 Tax=Fortiea contorta TaxID=1892405 RepID=UPI00034D59CF|nr:hypothetical protein [Fortiea contorta]